MTTQKVILCDDTIKIVITPKLEKILKRGPAIALQQLHFCLTSNEKNGKIYENRRWIYNTYEEWRERYIPQYCAVTIQRAFIKLEKMKIIDSRQPEKKYGNRRKSYTINYDVLDALISQYDEKHPAHKKPSKSLFIKESPARAISQQQTETLSYFPCIHHSKEDKTTHNFTETSETKEHKFSEEAFAMVHIWNEIIETNNPQKITLYPKRSNELLTIFNEHFNKDMNTWKDYCLKIASSKYLMGEVNNYRVRFSYATTPDGINEYLYSDKYTFGDRVAKDLSKNTQQTYSSPFAPFQEKEQARALRKSIKKTMAPDLYASWLEPTFISYDNEKNEFTLFTETRFMKDRIIEKFKDIAQKFANIHFQKGHFPEKYFGFPIHQEESLLTYNIISEIETTPDKIKATLLGHPSLTTNECDISIQNIFIHESDKEIINPVSTSEITFVNNTQIIEPIQSRGGDIQNTFCQETDKATLLRLKIRSSISPTLYESCFVDTFIIIDDEDKRFLLLKSDSKKDEIIACLNACGIKFLEMAVPENAFFEFYFGTAAQLSESIVLNESELISPIIETQQTFAVSNASLTASLELKENLCDAVPSIATHTKKRSVSYHTAMIKRIVHKINEIQNSEEIIENSATVNTCQNQLKATKCYDHHNKMIQWSQQNDTFLTKTTPKTTPYIIFFREAYTFFKNIQHEKIKIIKKAILKKIKVGLPQHLFRSQLTKLRQIIHLKIRTLNQNLYEEQVYTSSFSRFRSLQT